MYMNNWASIYPVCKDYRFKIIKYNLKLEA